MVQGHRRAQVAKLEGYQRHHPEMHRVNTAGVGYGRHRCGYQNHRPEGVHDHPQNHQDHYHQQHGRPGTVERLRESFHDVGALDHTTNAHRQPQQQQKGANLSGGIVGRATNAALQPLVIDLTGRPAPAIFQADMLIYQNGQHDHRQQPGRRKFVHLHIQGKPVEQHYGSDHDHIGNQWPQSLNGRRKGIGRRGKVKLALPVHRESHHRKHGGGQYEYPDAPAKQLIGRHLSVQVGNHHHQQTRPQYHTQGARHGRGRQGQMSARARRSELTVDNSTGSNHKNTGSTGIGGRYRRHQNGHHRQHLRRHTPGPENIENQSRQAGLFQHHAHPHVQPDIQEHVGQFHHLAQIDPDTGGMADQREVST